MATNEIIVTRENWDEYRAWLSGDYGIGMTRDGTVIMINEDGNWDLIAKRHEYFSIIYDDDGALNFHFWESE